MVWQYVKVVVQDQIDRHELRRKVLTNRYCILSDA